VTGGGFATDSQSQMSKVIESKKQDNGWTITWDYLEGEAESITVYAECLKVVNEGPTTG
jgi:hypothetical protein